VEAVERNDKRLRVRRMVSEWEGEGEEGEGLEIERNMSNCEKMNEGERGRERGLNGSEGRLEREWRFEWMVGERKN
jgi:hypothetical protein